ncbi:MAG: phenylacetate-CoA oxygenase subunit PaaJ [Phycisphaerales bacterium]|nr:phenylacetate-CoA oxygenase subunit PaaJ [Phycisphaerales bacterium]
MVAKSDIFTVLQTIPDPEMPISITDLGLIERVNITDSKVYVELLPTFIGCFALPAIAKEIKQKLGEVEGVDEVTVELINDPPWSTDRITDAGRASLAKHGISVPDGSSPCCSGTKTDTVELRTSAIPCPWCNSRETTLTSPFGPTRCKTIHFCNACRQPFERMKKL